MLIGFAGPSFSGKDTAYERIDHMFGGTRTVENLKNSYLMKKSIENLFELDPSFIEDNKRDANVKVSVSIGDHIHRSYTLREFIQRYGTEAHRGVMGDEFWVNLAFRNLNHEHKIVCVTDVRFPNEAEKVKALGGTVVYLDYSDPQYSASEASHPSESSSIRHWADLVIDNNIRADNFKHFDTELRILVEKQIRRQSEVGATVI